MCSVKCPVLLSSCSCQSHLVITVHMKYDAKLRSQQTRIDAYVKISRLGCLFFDKTTCATAKYSYIYYEAFAQMTQPLLLMSSFEFKGNIHTEIICHCIAFEVGLSYRQTLNEYLTKPTLIAVTLIRRYTSCQVAEDLEYVCKTIST